MSKEKFSNTVRLIMGDWSADGHGKTDTVVINSNLSTKEVAESYELGAQKLGFNFIDDVAFDYQDSMLSHDKLLKLSKNGFTPELYSQSSYDQQEFTNALDSGEGLSLWTDSFSAIFLFIVKLGNNNFEYEITQGNDITIGGYGLYE